MSTYSLEDQIGSLAFVCGLSAIAGIAFGLLTGFEFPRLWFFPGYKLKPLMIKFQIPPLVPMIIMGFIARNFVGELSLAYPPKLAAWLRNCVLAVLLTRGGMAVTFRGKGLIVLLVVFVPQLIEATTVALVSHGVFQMPINAGYCLGYCVASIAGSLVMPGMLSLIERGYGGGKGVPGILVGCCTFDNIAAIIFFGIVKAITMSEAEAEIEGKPVELGMAIGWLFIQNLAGLGVGIICGLAAWLFKFINCKHVIYLKAVYMTSMAVTFIIVSEFSTFTDAKFIACMSFGYACSLFWGTSKPMKELGLVWFFVQPALFGTVGASLVVKNI
jgi:solute carrier family 9B (sodium/hydrogen exchanger), member 1/2